MTWVTPPINSLTPRKANAIAISLVFQLHSVLLSNPVAFANALITLVGTLGA
jgi:hypothetical protein